MSIDQKFNIILADPQKLSIDFSPKIAYTGRCLDRRIAGRFAFLNAAIQHNIYCGQSAPYQVDSRPVVCLSNCGKPVKGRFVMGTKGLKLPSRTKYDMSELTGKKYGSRTIIDRGENTKSKNHTVKVRCDCGDISTVETARFLAGRHQMCLSCANKKQTGDGHPGWRGGRHISMTAYTHWLNSAVRRNMVWELSIDYLDSLIESQDFRCALTGEELTIGHGNNNGLVTRGSASLDRIDSRIGYIIGNVQFVIKSVNMAKQDMPEGDFIELCRKVAKHAG